MESHFDFSSIVQPNIVALKVLGFWRSSHQSSIFNKIWYNAYTVIVILLQIFCEGTGFLYLYDKWESLSLVDINSVIFIYSTGVVNLAMMILIFFNLECVHFIQSTMKSEEMFQCKSQVQAMDARKWKDIARVFQMLFYCSNVFLNIAVVFLSFWSDEPILVGHKPSFLPWRVFSVLQAFLGIYSAQMSATYVTLVTSLLVEIIIQLCLLEKALENVKDSEGIRRNVEWHLQILVFIKKVQHICEIGVSGVFLCGVINICTSMSLLMEVEYVKLLFILPYLLEMIMIIFSHCWCGSEVLYQNEKISLAIYSSQWTNADKSYREILNLYILLTQKPLQIRLGGGVTTASLPVFITIIKSAYSAFTILQRFK